MDRISDERIAFYLKHRQEIDAWAKIAQDVPRVTDRFLRSLDGDILRLKQELGAHDWTWNGDSTWFGYFLAKKAWLEGSDRPVAACGIAWMPEVTTFGHNPPFVGIWTDETRGKGIAGAEDIRLFAQRYQGYQSKPALPAVAPVPPDAHDQYWKDLNPYRGKLMDSVRKAWKDLASAVTEAVS